MSNYNAHFCVFISRHSDTIMIHVISYAEKDTAHFLFLAEMPPIAITCQFGGLWNTPRLPTCIPVYCGAIPPVDNARVVVNGSGISFFTGAQEGDTVTYECLPIVASPPAASALTISCLGTGEWSTPPTCSRKLTIASISDSPRPSRPTDTRNHMSY